MKKEKFNWGESSDWYRTQINHEIFDGKMCGTFITTN